jgi:HEAT repeat protein
MKMVRSRIWWWVILGIAMVVLVSVAVYFWACDYEGGLIRQLTGGSESERVNAARRLGLTRSQRAYDPLIRALQDESPKVRAAAAEGLGYLGNPRALRALQRAYNRDKDGPYASRYLRALNKLATIARMQ